MQFDDLRVFSSTFHRTSRLVSQVPFSVVNPLPWSVRVERRFTSCFRLRDALIRVRGCPNLIFSGPPWIPAGRGLENPISDACPKAIDSLYTLFMRSGLLGSGGCGRSLGRPRAPQIADSTMVFNDLRHFSLTVLWFSMIF